jgi:FMN-dependent NADH-azoreductase
MSLFRLDASFRVEGSVSRQIADVVETAWRAGHPDAEVVTRHVGADPVPATYWAAAVTASMTPAESLTQEQKAAVALAATLTDELIDADALLFAVPLYNFGVPQHFKSYVDLVITDPRMGPGATPPLAGKPAELHQLGASHPRRRVAARPDDRGNRVHARRRQPGAGRVP